MVEAAAVLLLVRIGLWTLPFSVLRAVLDRTALRTHPSRAGSPSDVGRIVGAVARRLPMPMTCLVQALAAKAMLRRRGHDATLRFGVRSGGIGAGAFDAHAWLVCEGRVVVGEFDDAGGYVALEPAVREASNAT